MHQSLLMLQTGDTQVIHEGAFVFCWSQFSTDGTFNPLRDEWRSELLKCSRNGLVCEATALLQPVVQHGLHIEVPEYECSKSDAIVFSCSGLMI